MTSSAAPAQFPSSSKAADQSPAPAVIPFMVACPINVPEDGLGVGLQPSG